MKSWKCFLHEKSAAKEEDFGPMIDIVLERAIEKLEACKKSGIPERVVISQGMHREGRDYICKKVAEHPKFAKLGVKQIFYIGLAASLNKKIQRWHVKQDDLIPATTGKTHAEAFMEKTGLELTDENFKADFLKTMEKYIPLMSKYDIEEDEIQNKLGANVWLDDGDDKIFPSMRKVLGLPLGENESDDPAQVRKLLEESAKKLVLHGNFAKKKQAT